MAFFFGKKKKEPPPFSEIGAESSFAGEIISKNLVKVNGVVEGLVKSELNIETGDKSEIRGKIISPKAVLNGSLVGDIETDFLSISTTAKVDGTIKTKRIKIEKGAEVIGKIF